VISLIDLKKVASDKTINSNAHLRGFRKLRKNCWHHGCFREAGVTCKSEVPMHEIVSLKKIEEEFLDWCSLLSLDELCSNPKLISIIERVERMLLTMTQTGGE